MIALAASDHLSVGDGLAVIGVVIGFCFFFAFMFRD